MSGRVFLGVDLGAESGRVTAGVFDGGRVRLEELHRFPNGPVEVAGSWRWDVQRLWQEIQRGLSITAAQFLQRFVDDTPWAHLDIAGTAMGSPKTEINQSWGSGYGVRLLERLVAEYYEGKR